MQRPNKQFIYSPVEKSLSGKAWCGLFNSAIINWFYFILSAEELMHHGSKEAKLPETGGIKYYGPEESDEQKSSVKKALDQYHQILHEERICRK